MNRCRKCGQEVSFLDNNHEVVCPHTKVQEAKPKDIDLADDSFDLWLGGM